MSAVAKGNVVELSLGDARGWLVIDSYVLDRCWGGIRIQPKISVAEVSLLAKLMTLKSALAGIPIGGAKIGIDSDPSTTDMSKLTKALAESLHKLIREGKYIPGTDMGFTEENLEHLYRCLKMRPSHTLHRFSGDFSQTGLAVAESLYAAIEETINISGVWDCETVALQGFGNMGTAAAHVLSERGFRLVAVSNKYHTLVCREGIDICTLLKLKKIYGEDCLRQYQLQNGNCEVFPSNNLFEISADILVPGAGVLQLQKKPKCKIVAPLANYPLSLRLVRELESRGTHVIPDIVANAGGAIGSALSVLKRDFELDKKSIMHITRCNVRKVWEKALKDSTTPTETAYLLAWTRFNRLRKSGLLGLPCYVKPLADATGINAICTALRNQIKSLTLF